MNKNILRITIFAFSLMFGQAVFADHTWMCDDGLKHMIKSLKLDNSQLAKIQVIQEQSRAHMKPTWEKMQGLREQVNLQIQSENMDQSKLDDLMNTKTELIGKMMKEKAMARHQMYLVLNPQQRTQYQKMSQKWEEKIEKKYAKCHKENDDD